MASKAGAGAEGRAGASESATIYLTRSARKVRPRNTTERDEALVLICEGLRDIEFVKPLANRILPNRPVSVIAAGGKLATAGLANQLRPTFKTPARFLLIVDSDGDMRGTQEDLRSRVEVEDVEIIVAHPSLEAWATTADSFPRLSKDEVEQLASTVQVDAPNGRTDGLAEFVAFLRRA